MCSTCNCKRWATNFTVACFFLAGGVEYSVILPTMFDYLTKQFDGKEWLYGLCLSAFSISNLFMGPLFGFVFDQTHRTKLIVLFANLFEIGGNPKLMTGVVSEPDPRKIGREGLVNGAGWKCTLWNVRNCVLSSPFGVHSFMKRSRK